jgi:NAD(P)H-dependent FMN reductase
MKLQVIIGTTRPGRVTDRIALWAANEAKKLPDTTVEVVDLADYPLPFLDEAISPQYNPDRKPNEVAKKFIDKLAEAEAYVIVTPEYNRSIAGVLKNALDYVDFQLAKKPVAIVAHGSTGGAQALAHLRGILPGLKSFGTPTATFITGRAGEMFDETGKPSEAVTSSPYGPQASLQTTLQELKWYSDALSAARAKG